MRSALQHNVHNVRLGKRHKAKAARSSAFDVLHYDAVVDVAVALEVAVHVLLGRLPREAADKQFAAKKERDFGL